MFSSSAKGIIDVTGIGMGSNTHQRIHNRVMPAVMEASSDRPCWFSKKVTSKASNGPAISSPFLKVANGGGS